LKHKKPVFVFLRWVARPFLAHRRLTVILVALAVTIGVTYTYLQAPILWFVHVVPGAIPSPEANAERLLIIAPHPDDDVLSLGGTMAVTAKAGGSVLVVYLTSGDANRAGERLIAMMPFLSAPAFRALGGRREKEAVLALSRLGVPAENAIFLNYPDQGLMDLVTRNWSSDTPYRSRYTAQGTTYSRTAYRQGAVYSGENVLADLVDIIFQYRPTRVYVPHPSDTHPDHGAGYFLAVLAVETALARDPTAAPDEVRCYLTHSLERPWPSPRGGGAKREMEVPRAILRLDSWESTPLPAWSVRAKLAAIRSHFSQWWTSGRTMATFARTNEICMVVHVDATGIVPHWPLGLVPGSV